MKSTCSVLFFALIPLGACLSNFEKYIGDRNSFMQSEQALSINSVWNLSPAEAAVDKLLTQYKKNDLNLDPVPVQFNFKTMQPTIDKSELFSLLQSFPKGSLLHSHDVSSQDMHLYVEASYLDGCLFNIANTSDFGILSFVPGENFVPISEIRNSW